MKKPEILAPAGSWEALLAAIAAGADAVYLGGRQFGARAYASNFDEDALQKALHYAHLRGVKIYVTVNTLIKDNEMAAAYHYAVWLYQQGVDGLIVQDWGLLSLLRRQLPTLPLSGSTQMSLHNSAGVQGAALLWGLNRIILARETSLVDIQTICDLSPIECEIFVHGALCICYSGQCLFSSMVGGRSGNRGRCAQPCRLPYTLLDSRGKEVAQGHLLSPKDLQSYPLLTELVQSGVASWKIEGRMKRPEYVATVTEVYQEGLEQAVKGNFTPMATEEKRLEQAFNREFTTGYLLGNEGRDLMSYRRPNNRGSRLGRVEEGNRPGGPLRLHLEAPLTVGDGLEVWVTKGGRQGFKVERMEQDGQAVQEAAKGVSLLVYGAKERAFKGDRVFKTHDVKLMAAAQERYATQQLLPLTFKLIARQGQPLTLEAANEAGEKIIYTSAFLPVPAEKHGADEAFIQKQLGRLGGSGWQLQQLELDVEDGLLLPASVLNEARRQAIAALEEKMLQGYARSAIVVSEPVPPARKRPESQPELAVYVENQAAAQKALAAGVTLLYVGGETWQGQKPWSLSEIETLAKRCSVVYVLPRIATENELPHWRQWISALQKTAVTALCCGNLWAVQVAQEVGWTKELWGDFGLNIFNSWAGDVWQKKGLTGMMLSPELNWVEIEALSGTWRKEALVHGNIPLMVSAHCPLGALVGGAAHKAACSRPCRHDARYFLRDEKGYSFPAISDIACRMHLFNPHQLCMIEDVPRFALNGIERLRLDLRFYQPEQVGQVVRLYRQALTWGILGEKNKIATAKEQLQTLVPGKLTKGHYYRGVE